MLQIMEQLRKKIFASLKNINNLTVYEDLAQEFGRNKDKKRIICCYSDGSLDRMKNILTENKIKNLAVAETWAQAEKETAKEKIALIRLELQHGFTSHNYFIVTEQDIWGERKNIRAHKKVSAENLIADISSLNIGEYVVHIEHGIGRFEGVGEHRNRRRSARLPEAHIRQQRQTLCSGGKH